MHPEGDFSKRPDAKWQPGERSNVVKREDNLQPEGDFQKRPNAVWAPGERSNIVKRDDNLVPEGEFHKRVDTLWAPGERSEVRIMQQLIKYDVNTMMIQLVLTQDFEKN